MRSQSTNSREEDLKDLDRRRLEIDDLDQRLLALLNERTRVVEEIGRVKRRLRLPIYEPKREDEVYANITAHNRGPLPSEAVRRVFERIIDEMRTVQKIRMQEEEKQRQAADPPEE